MWDTCMKFHMLGIVAHLCVGTAHDTVRLTSISLLQNMKSGMELNIYFPLFSVVHSSLLCSTNT